MGIILIVLVLALVIYLIIRAKKSKEKYEVTSITTYSSSGEETLRVLNSTYSLREDDDDLLEDAITGIKLASLFSNSSYESADDEICCNSFNDSSSSDSFSDSSSSDWGSDTDFGGGDDW